jgi:hypothetical protein
MSLPQQWRGHCCRRVPERHWWTTTPHQHERPLSCSTGDNAVMVDVDIYGSIPRVNQVRGRPTTRRPASTHLDAFITTDRSDENAGAARTESAFRAVEQREGIRADGGALPQPSSSDVPCVRSVRVAEAPIGSYGRGVAIRYGSCRARCRWHPGRSASHAGRARSG